MASTDFKIGAIAKVDREHRTHKTKDGQYIVVIKTSENDKKADLEVFDSEEDAKKAAADVLGTGAGTGTRPTARSVQRRTHRPPLHHHGVPHSQCCVCVRPCVRHGGPTWGPRFCGVHVR